MKTATWLARLGRELPGWFVWYSSRDHWHAVPAPAGTTLEQARRMPYDIGPISTPQELRDAARERYADGDTCQTCNDDWRLCGHRTDETRDPGWRSMT